MQTISDKGNTKKRTVSETIAQREFGITKQSNKNPQSTNPTRKSTLSKIYYQLVVALTRIHGDKNFP